MVSVLFYFHELSCRAFCFFFCILPRATEEVNETLKNLGDEKPGEDEVAADGNKENPANEVEEKEPEDKVIVLFYFKCFDFTFFCLCILSMGLFLTLSLDKQKIYFCHWQWHNTNLSLCLLLWMKRLNSY